MATTVKEIMNRELFSVCKDDPVSSVTTGILALGVTGAPVVDKECRPLGLVSLRDLVSAPQAATAGDLMTSPAQVINEEATIREAAHLLSDAGLHRLVAVDDSGRAVGVVSALDVIRGLIGIPASHPAPFPHLDQKTGLTWTDDTPLEMDKVEAAPNGPGLLVLIQGGAGVPEIVVWAESIENIQTRLIDLLSYPQREQPLLAHWLEHGTLRFRAAALADLEERKRLLGMLLEQAMQGTRPKTS